MKIILYIVSILAIGGAAYFSFDHSVKFKDQQKVRLETIAKNKNVTSEAEATEKDLADEKKALKLAQDDREEATQSIAALKSNETALKRQLAELDATLDEQKKELSDLNEAIQRAKEGLKAAGLGEDITLENIGEKLKELEDTKKNLERELEEKQTLVAAAEKRLSGNKVEADRLTDRKMQRNARMARNAMESVITAVDQNWGFVVIGAGSKSGFTPQTLLLVKRDGKLIGKIRPTAIEPTQTIADIVPESMAPGVRLQAG
jgi:septal ring factor EnvC (AmiA/AmiB activator)